MSNSNLPPSENPANFWKWFGIGCGGCLLTSILALGGLGYFVYRNLQISTNSRETVDLARSIFDYEIPGGAKGILTVKFMDIEFAQIVNKNGPLEVLMLLGEIPEGYISDRQDLVTIRESVSRNQNSNFTIESQEVSDKELCGETVKVLVQQGKFSLQGETNNLQPASSYTAIVNYNSTDRFVWLVARGEQSNEKVESVFNSLECK